MHYRRFGRTGWNVSEMGYGMWGLAGWTGSEEGEYSRALDLSVDLGCNFYDTAWAYASGLSEQILGQLLRRHAEKKLYVATKIPAKNFTWPSRPEFRIEDCFPYDHIIKYTEKSLKNLGVDCIDLQQFHVWEDGWADNEEWQRAVEKLITDGKVKHFGISVNRWEPNNCLKTLDSGLISAIQVIYNIFDQAPEDQLFPKCKKLDVAIIARVPFDEGTLTGTMTKDSKFPANDWRSTYFVQENLDSCIDKADALRPIIPTGMTMPEMALRFILENDTVSTIIPGMRSTKNVTMNMATSDGNRLDNSLLQKLKTHRWDREKTSWSQ